MEESSEKNNLRKKVEKHLKKTPRATRIPSQEEAQILLHELEVHQVELEMQNKELRETQYRLEASRDKYTDLFDFAPIGYLILDKRSVILDINLTACKLFGIDRIRIKKKPLSVYVLEESDKMFLNLREAFKTGVFSTLELRINTKAGGYITAIMQGTVDLDNGSVCRISLQDVTELRKAEELKRRNEELENEHIRAQKYAQELEKKVQERTRELDKALQAERLLNEMKSDFISTASHEFRTPLSTILASSSLIKKYSDLGKLEKIDNFVGRIHSSVKQLTRILEGFLSLGKLEKGVISVHNDAFDLRNCIEEIIEELAWMLKPKQHILYSYHGNNEVVLDQKILRNILLNLISNGLKYSDTDVNINIQVKQNSVIIVVTDKGIGISRSDQKHLYTIFFRAKEVENIQGTGLGLSIIKRNINLMKGTIECESKLNEGTTFTVTLPKI